MLLKENIRLRSIISGTWKNALAIVLVCLLSSAFNEFLLKKHIEFPAIMPSLLGTTLAFFIGFNNNQAYGRWWEARIIMGAISGDCRTLARQCVNYIRDKQTAEKMVYRQIAFVYALKEYLRGTKEKSYEIYLKDGVPDYLRKARNKHSAILYLQTKHLEEIYAKEYIDGFKFGQINETLNNIGSQMGKAERIKTTVFPTTYSYYTKLFIWIFIIFVTIVLDNTVGIFSVLFGSIIGYVYYVSHSVGQTLLSPFEPTPVSVPLDHITRNIEINLKEMLGEENLPEPTSNVDDEYIL